MGHGLAGPPPPSLAGRPFVAPCPSTPAMWQGTAASVLESPANSAGTAWKRMTWWRATVAACSNTAATANQFTKRHQRLRKTHYSICSQERDRAGARTCPRERLAAKVHPSTVTMRFGMIFPSSPWIGRARGGAVARRRGGSAQLAIRRGLGARGYGEEKNLAAGERSASWGRASLR